MGVFAMPDENFDDAGIQEGYNFDYEDAPPIEFDPELLRDKVAEELENIDVAQDAIDADKEKEKEKREESEAKAAAEKIFEFDEKETKKLKVQKKFYENLSKNKDLNLQEIFQIDKIIAQIDWQKEQIFPRNFEKLKELIQELNKMRSEYN